MGEVVVGVAGALAFAAWLFAVVNWIGAVRRRAEGVTLGTLLTNGMRSFDAASFTPEGQRYQRRFLLGFGLFFLCVFLTVGAAVLAHGLSR